jgi:hypothetical protein
VDRWRGVGEKMESSSYDYDCSKINSTVTVTRVYKEKKVWAQPSIYKPIDNCNNISCEYRRNKKECPLLSIKHKYI